MKQNKYSLLNILIQRFASTKSGAWFGAQFLHHSDRLALLVTGGHKTITAVISGLPIVILTTTGAKSGMPRTIPLVRIPDDRSATRFALIASNWGQHSNPAWFYNLKACPQALCNIDGIEGIYVGSEAEGEEYDRLWARAAELYFAFDLYKLHAGNRRIPVMIMSPIHSKKETAVGE